MIASLPLKHLRQIQEVLGADAGLFVVGGALRDLLLERPSGDIDLATSLLPEDMLARAKGRLRAIPTGIQHGTVTLMVEGQAFEITTFRSDGDYLDGRHPESVHLGVALEEDLARRDFTINAMALPVEALELQNWEDAIVDPFGGRQDLDQRILRAVGDPLKRFAEDGLRTLRACRFASQLVFEVEAETIAAIPKRLEVARKVAVERVFSELTKLLCGQDPAGGLRLLETTGLMDLWLPELRPMVGCTQNRHHCFDVWEHTLNTFAQELSGLSEHRWALLLHDVGKPAARTVGEDGEAHFYVHEKRSTAMAEVILQRLRAPNQWRGKVVSLIALHGEYPDDQWSPAAFRRLLKRLNEASITPDQWGQLRLADQWGKGWAQLERLPDGRSGAQWWEDTKAHWNWTRERLTEHRFKGMNARELALDGRALMALADRLGGPWLGQLQKHLLEEVLEDPDLNTIEGITGLAKEWMKREL